jgi:pseudouridine synthase
MGEKIDPDRDVVTLDGGEVKPPREGLVYYILNKPRGYLTTARDQRGRKTVYNLLGAVAQRVVPVGRLDMDSEGLLLLTNDGELAHRIMHPSFRIEKQYEVEIPGSVGDQACRRLREGVVIDGGKTQPATIEVKKRTSAFTKLLVTIREGKKRQIRRMLEAVGYEVARLVRVREGGLRLGTLPSGETRCLTPREVEDLRREAGFAGENRSIP